MKLHNNELLEETAEDITNKEELVVQGAADIQADNDSKLAKANLKASAKAKLIAGEALTEAEADTIVI